MTTWPALDPELAERLMLGDAAFRAMIDEFMAALELPAYDDAFYERAIAYPWSRPAGSYALDGETVLPLTPGNAALIGGDLAARTPLLAIGSNGAPSTLARKFAHLPREEQQVLVVAGHLHGFDVGPAARITPYGSLPATPFVSPETAVRASVLWVTQAQLTALTWTELSYFVGWIGPTEFEPDVPEAATGTPAVDHALLYVSRWGTLTDHDGLPLALDSLAARDRTAAARGQAELLERVANEVHGPSVDGRRLLRRLADAPLTFMRELEPWMAQHAAPFDSHLWHPFPREPRGGPEPTHHQ
ncbi:MAG: hypothetical protein JHD16_08280 [Solirubrobacteraceae bacterium]|nr:hypothetical protein [Solirubrobacteraceae bacterium]